MTTVDNELPAQDWWDRLYAEAEDTFAEPVALPQPRVEVRSRRDRLPKWWERKNTDVLTADPEPTDEQETTAEEGQEGDAPVSTEPVVEAEGQEADDASKKAAPGQTIEAAPDHQVFYPQPGYWGPAQAMAEKVTPPKPAISPGTRRLFYNVGAGGAGWLFGLTPALSEAIETAGVATSIGGALTLGIGTCLAIAAIWDRRTRHWIPPLAWAARIPLMSAITALALYAPAAPH
ncbi:hypothetical protein ACIQGT_41045 [Streptomyces sp. NPDC093108]|jgi:hypothetical protein|uniref:hypothetical protein n=1 Tax=unclassified Streptomyces TaxID=2593676 RepID=UPI0037F4C6C7